MGTVCHTIILARVAWVALCCIDDVEAIQSSWCDSVALDWLKSQKVALHASTNFRISLQLKIILDNNSVDQSFQLYSGWLDARLRFYWWQICGRSSPCASPESRVNSALWFMAHDGRASRVVITLMPAWLEAELYSYVCEYIKSYSNSLIFVFVQIYGLWHTMAVLCALW